MRGQTDVATLKASSKVLTVSIAPGLPRDSSEYRQTSTSYSLVTHSEVELLIKDQPEYLAKIVVKRLLVF